MGAIMTSIRLNKIRLIKKYELEIIDHMITISEAIKNLNEAVFNYEAHSGKDINDLKFFINNYPFRNSLDEIDEWGWTDDKDI
jgi:hypothetical protein